ncbi:MAG: MFS transporter [Caldilineales bacterium]|nr:MFS transporter [Caldilineales bacterium]
MTASAAAPPSDRRARISWYLYDFGNSAFASVIYLAVFSTYFKQEVVGGAEGTRLWGLAIGIALFIVAIIAPILGAVADFSGAKKKFLLFFTAIAILFTGLLFFVQKGDILMGMMFFILAEIGYRSGQLFYDAFLPEVAGSDDMGKVSGIGWAIGSAGGVIALLIILPLVLVIGGTLIVRLSMVITALFWVLAAIPLVFWLHERAKPRPLPAGENYVSVAIKQVVHTVRTASQYPQMTRFMIAFLLYGSGVAIALEFAAIIGATLYGMGTELIIVFAIIVQITNVIGAFGFGLLVPRTGVKTSLILSLLLMLLVVAALYFNQSQIGFIIIGAVAGIAMAGVQSLSRTAVGLFAPPPQTAEFFGFFTMVGRLAFWIGPLVFGFVAAEAALWYEGQGVAIGPAEQQGLRLAVLSIGLFLVVGLIVFLAVNEKAGRAAAQIES